MATMNLTVHRLRERLSYDPETGVFTWRVRPAPNTNVGDVAGSWNGNGYLQVSVDGVQHPLHRLAHLYMEGYWPAGEVDHRDGDKGNNRWLNLRDGTKAINMQNKRKAQANNRSTGLLGAYFDWKRGKFSASIKLGGKSRYLGSFDTAEAAHLAYVEAKRVLHPGCTL